MDISSPLDLLEEFENQKNGISIHSWSGASSSVCIIALVHIGSAQDHIFLTPNAVVIYEECIALVPVASAPGHVFLTPNAVVIYEECALH